MSFSEPMRTPRSSGDRVRVERTSEAIPYEHRQRNRTAVPSPAVNQPHLPDPSMDFVESERNSFFYEDEDDDNSSISTKSSYVEGYIKHDDIKYDDIKHDDVEQSDVEHNHVRYNDFERGDIGYDVNKHDHDVREDGAEAEDVRNDVTPPKTEETLRATPDDDKIPNQAARLVALNTAMEHRIFLKALLELLGERDQFAFQVDLNDPNMLKAGPLRKASHRVRSVWKVKHVEIRRGLFVYYEDSISNDGKGEEMQRKMLPLHASNVTCRAVRVQHKTMGLAAGVPGGAVFELSVNGGSRRLWMANSKEQRQAWIAAINEAMVGGSRTRGHSHVDYTRGIIPKRSPYRENLEKYIRVQTGVKSAVDKESYMLSVWGSMGTSINVPVQWIRAQFEVSSTLNADEAFLEEDVADGMYQLYKDLKRDSVNINGEMFVGDSGHGVERIIGALTRIIMSYDRTFPEVLRSSDDNGKKIYINESQAVAYARDILLSCNRTRSGGDSYYCVDTLCSNPNLVALCPSSMEAEPLTIMVRHAPVVQAPSGRFDSANNRSGWLKTRSKDSKAWKKRYFVLSDGTLSYYEQAKPRPHGLHGQLSLAGATFEVRQGDKRQQSRRRFSRSSSITEENTSDPVTVVISTGDRSNDRELWFHSQEKFRDWAAALRNVTQPKSSSESQKYLGSQRTLDARGSQRTLDSEATSYYDPLHPEGHDESSSDLCYLNEKNLNTSVGIKGGRARPSVEISIRATTSYKICTLDPEGVESLDTWCHVSTHFLQKFHLSGGALGRIVRGEEVVELQFLDSLEKPSFQPRSS